ncbi:MAG TPA: DUF5916 domain-containing protein [Gemmatimonadaceae bacterium]|nr:DUF5916 domain-containing protein [Gemmatimonadaceae bacterium]
MRRLSVAIRASLVAVALALLPALLAPPLHAQQGTPPAAPPLGAAASARAVRADRAPHIDGREDDAVWRAAPATADFQEFQPVEGKAPRYRTEFKAAYDDRHLYVFVRAFDPHPDSIMTALTRRDVRGPSDQLKVMVDSYNDRRSGFEFAVNPVGVKRDFAMYNDNTEDDAWDGVWDVGTRVDSVGWTAEFRIPFSQLRYADKAEHVFGFGVWRDIERYKERTSWPLYRSSQSGISSQLGQLVGIADISPFRRLEVVPFAVAKNASIRQAPVAGRPPGWDRAQSTSLGADVKYGITPNLTLDATVNPDFGQVEADPAVLNLSAFEQFFQERRPFFVEGSGLYAFSQNSSPVNRSSEGLFYSRRIGRSPQLLSLYGDDWSPNTTPILGAAKLTGRLPSGLSLGVVEAVTGRETGAEARTTEPRTAYTVLRAQQELRGGRSSLGVIATGVNRALDEWSREYLRREAYVVGSDLRHRWGKSQYELNAKVTGSLVRGTAEAIHRTQLHAVHNYQRPDDDFTADSTRTSLTGDAQEINVAKFGGNMLRWLTGYERQSAGYEPNDLGYLRRANRQTWKTWMGLNFQKPTRVYRRMSLNFNYQSYWTADGLRMDHMVNSNGSMQLANNQWLNYGVTLGALPGSFCDNCARGGPAVRVSPIVSYNGGWQGDDRRRIYPMLFFYRETRDAGRSTSWSVDPEVELRLLPQLQLSLGASWNKNDDDGQWLGNFDEEGTATTHYAFAHLAQETRSAWVRVNYAVTPTLSLQMYAAPYVSRGAYDDVRELSATPRADRYEDRFTPYVPPEDAETGFNLKDLRSNSVLRWEFRPGSTLFAVWQHGRSDYDPRFLRRSWRSEYGDLFALRPDNTFLVKVAYWLNR